MALNLEWQENWIENWDYLFNNSIDLLRKKRFIDFTPDEVFDIKSFILWLDNNRLLDFANQYESLNSGTSYDTFLIFLWVLFSDDLELLSVFESKLKSLKEIEEWFKSRYLKLL